MRIYFKRFCASLAGCHLSKSSKEKSYFLIPRHRRFSKKGNRDSLFMLLPVILFSLALEASCQKTIYGRDDRMDVCESPDEDELFKDIARNSIAAVMVERSLVLSNGRYDTALSRRSTLGQQRHLCSDQRFVDQPVAASCSATLVAPDRVVTAGHCITATNCPSKRFVFNFLYDNFDNNVCVMPSVTPDDVYSCRYVDRIETSTVDWAVVHLDRPVVGRVPVLVERNRVALHARQNLTVIGFGSGIPAKIDRGGRVIDPRSNTLDYFTASTDTFGGNSGSGVFDDSGKMVGILVRGQRDYAVTSAGCSVVNVQRCSDEYCTGLQDAEELTYAWRAMAGMPDCNTDTDCPLATVICIPTSIRVVCYWFLGPWR
eukprot:c19631_g2_i2.p2 GENE.c19631_g2_i2~~c19631_g2_i2.p2  ORF type:complete len:372 (+),score=62.93 c19631_g2_i2:1342-2457(+)